MESLKLNLVGSFWRAPLVPAALVVTTGIVVDRYCHVPLLFSLGMGAACLLAWGIASMGRNQRLGLVYLAVAGFAVGAALHHYRHDVFADDDIGYHAPNQQQAYRDEQRAKQSGEEKPSIRVRGILDEEPDYKSRPNEQPLVAIPRSGYTTTKLQARQQFADPDWVAVSGRLLVVIPDEVNGLHVGDEVEVAGELLQLEDQVNPGSFNARQFYRDQGICARLTVRGRSGSVIRLDRTWPYTLDGWLAHVRAWGERQFSAALPNPKTSKLAIALVLGEQSALPNEDWDKYKRTGVIHVLVVSGQHLVVLAICLWWVLRRLGLRQRHSAWVVAIFLLLYVLLTGGRPPGMRSAVTVCAICGALVLRRRVLPANLLALSWLIVAFLNPMDLFSPGCQLSFLSVLVLYRFGILREQRTEADPLQQHIDEHRPVWLRFLRRLGWGVVESYLVAIVVWLPIAPLVAYHYHMVPLVAVVIGPPVALLTAVALVTGFLLLLVASVGIHDTLLAGPVIHYTMSGCEWIVSLADNWGYGTTSVSDVPLWWLVGFYILLGAWLTNARLLRYWRTFGLLGLAWLCLGLLGSLVRLPSDELRCTFLAVGHGGCAVLETPDGRTLLYDAGAITGPNVTERQVVPYLQWRGVRQIDEVILSHADMDHFNGLEVLLQRFPIGQVTCTPTFADKKTPGVEYVLEQLKIHRIPLRIVKAGDRLTAGDVQMDVLHPPAAGPEGNENTRSLVLRVQHAGQTILLTGDLEGEGMDRVLHTPKFPVDVLQAPHHGSHRIDAEGLVKWANPRVIISSQGKPRSFKAPPPIYREHTRHFFTTWEWGAVTVRSHATGLVVETFSPSERFAFPTRRKDAKK